MFMKIFTVLTISFNNIFTIPPNINNDKTTIQLIRTKRQSDKIYNFEIENLEKVYFHLLRDKNRVGEINMYQKDNINLNKKLPELKNLNKLIFLFTKEFYNNQDKQDKITKLITTYRQKITGPNGPNIKPHELWIINKKITIKVQSTKLEIWDNSDNTIDYTLRNTSNFEIKIENP
ncbi:hypothetical protein [Spiroplasma endosymbiont of Agriotes lineatus]|uniref:hypothetical protein n=1 Tax=Spiroplasma endosymbiont of Agriotes lineatus TaxID=3077930 RepID=UPI0030D59967